MKTRLQQQTYQTWLWEIFSSTHNIPNFKITKDSLNRHVLLLIFNAFRKP